MTSPTTTAPATATFPGNPESVRAARRFVATETAGHPCLDDALLVISELATNAVRHTRSGQGGSYDVLVTVAAASVRIEVMDQGGGNMPCLRLDRGVAENGRGLAIVADLATEWGHQTTDAGTRVQAVLTAVDDLVTMR
jgi:serine/threonine-protein kinase RsbW